jgi:hypothetical protein
MAIFNSSPSDEASMVTYEVEGYKRSLQGSWQPRESLASPDLTLIGFGKPY